MRTTIKPAIFLMFSGKNYGKAEEAINFYTSLFEHSTIDKITYYEEGEEWGKPGTIKEAHFTMMGQHYMAHDSVVDHAFNFTPSISIYITFEGEEENLKKVYAGLAEGGLELMPLDDYGFSKKFGWIQDKYGVTWQLSLV